MWSIASWEGKALFTGSISVHFAVSVVSVSTYLSFSKSLFWASHAMGQTLTGTFQSVKAQKGGSLSQASVPL